MIALSLWGLLSMQGLYEGMTEQMINNAIRSDSGAITLYKKGYRQENDISMLIMDDERIAGKLQSDPRVRSFTKRIKQDGLIATAQYSRVAKIYGIDLESEKAQGRLDDYLREGEYGFGSRRKGVMVGATLAKKLKIAVGKKIILSAQTIDGEVASIALKVTGIIKTNNMALDDFGVFIDLNSARDFLNVRDGVTQFCIILHEENKLSGLQHELEHEFADLEVFRWDEMYPALMQSREMMEIFSYVMYLLVFCVAALGIFGVILVSVLERTREFGMMLAIGSEFSLICKIVFSEAVFLGAIGFIMGSLLGGGTLYYFYVHGLDLSHFSAGLEEFGMDAVMYAIIKPEYFLTAFLAVLSATLLSIILPLRVLQKSRPVEAIQMI
jgi:ABC-type lipoprotein release transport system permease subunit